MCLLAPHTHLHECQLLAEIQGVEGASDYGVLIAVLTLLHLVKSRDLRGIQLENLCFPGGVAIPPPPRWHHWRGARFGVNVCTLALYGDINTVSIALCFRVISGFPPKGEGDALQLLILQLLVENG